MQSGLLPSFVCLFSHDISKTDTARITKLDTEMFHDESWKLTYFRIKSLDPLKQCRRGSLHSL